MTRMARMDFMGQVLFHRFFNRQDAKRDREVGEVGVRHVSDAQLILGPLARQFRLILFSVPLGVLAV
jgi:hypothetical protein